jgi:uncharacterized membrane protein SpoIIM required for sporulation
MSSTVFYYFSCDNNDNIAIAITLAVIMFCVGIFYFLLFCFGGAEARETNEIKETMI